MILFVLNLWFLKKACKDREYDLSEVEFLGDSAYCVQKVFTTADGAGLRIITKVGNTHKFEYEGEQLSPKEIIDRVKSGKWNYLDYDTSYQRLIVKHHTYGEVLLILRMRKLKNLKVIYDALLCNKLFYNAVRVHKSYKIRWEIELHFKYYKQYLSLGKSQFGKLGAIRSHLACVTIAGLLVSLYRSQTFRKISFRDAVKLISHELSGDNRPIINKLHKNKRKCIIKFLINKRLMIKIKKL